MSSAGQQANPQVAAQPQQPITLSENDLKHHSQELGLLGWIFGSKDNAPYNIAAVAIVAALGLLGYLLINHPENAVGVTLLGAIVTGGMGYIFGKSTS